MAVSQSADTLLCEHRQVNVDGHWSVYPGQSRQGGFQVNSGCGNVQCCTLVNVSKPISSAVQVDNS